MYNNTKENHGQKMDNERIETFKNFLDCIVTAINLWFFDERYSLSIFS